MILNRYETVDRLVDGDVFLIDGNRGTKKLSGEYVRLVEKALTYYRTSDGHTPQYTGNLNNITTNCIYNIATANVTNIPPNVGSWGFLVTLTHINPTYLAQVYFPMMSEEHPIFIRLKVNSNWSSWMRIIRVSDITQKWTTGKEYPVRSVVAYNGAIYLCDVKHTSSSSITPTNTSYWTEKSISEIIQIINTGFTTVDSQFVTINQRLVNIDAGVLSLNNGLSNSNTEVANKSRKISDLAVPDTLASYRANFQSHIDELYDTCVNKGSTPTSSTVAGIINAMSYLFKVSGTKNITANGNEQDVAAYASAVVNVQKKINKEAAQSTHDLLSHATVRTTKRYDVIIAYCEGISNILQPDPSDEYDNGERISGFTMATNLTMIPVLIGYKRIDNGVGEPEQEPVYVNLFAIGFNIPVNTEITLRADKYKFGSDYSSTGNNGAFGVVCY